jgi:hypothetical protein
MTASLVTNCWTMDSMIIRAIQKGAKRTAGTMGYLKLKMTGGGHYSDVDDELNCHMKQDASGS